MPNVSALDFDGSNDVVTVPSDTALNLASGDFTVECWFQDQTGSNHGDQSMLVKTQYDWLPANQPYRLWVSFGAVRVGYRVADTWYQISASMPGGNSDTGLHHVAMVYVRSGNNLSIYLNGSLAAGPTSMGATQAGNTDTFRIGDMGENGRWNGLIDEVRLWSVARTGTEINDYKGVKASGSETNLVACFHLDENTGTTTADATAAARTGTLNGPAWTTTGLPTLTDAGGGAAAPPLPPPIRAYAHLLVR